MNDKSTRKHHDPEDEEMILMRFLIPIMQIAMIMLVIVSVAFCLKIFTCMRPSGWETDYSASCTNGNEIEDIDPERLNLAVLPDYKVSDKNPYIYIPYPNDNLHDVSFTFRDKADGVALYSTKRVRPGTVVRINPYEFCNKGDNPICVDVTAYLGSTSKYYVKNVTLETNINKEGTK